MIEVVEEQKEQGDKQHYIPHHAVIKPENNTTKLRVVYDASTETKKFECLHIGPVILDCIYGLLMRFRTKTIGLQPKERDFTRFLRLADINLPVTPTNIIKNCFTRVVFGIISRSLLLGATINYYLESGN